MVNIRKYLAANSDKSLDSIIEFLHSQGYSKARIGQCIKDWIDSP